ncbi:hypothetical protein ACUR5C_04020 [Aliikangiella sp. IMCC44653]
MNSPSLTANIENKLLSLIEIAEKEATISGAQIDSKLYMQLADLHHFHKNYAKEVKILERFTKLDNNTSPDLVDIYERIDSVTKLIQTHQAHSPKSVAQAMQGAASLELVNEEEETELKPVKHKPAVEGRVNPDKKPFSESTVRVLTICAAYTGRADTDELVQIALVLFEYQDSRQEKGKILETYWGERSTLIKVPPKTLNQFSIKQVKSKVSNFDPVKITAMFELADFVVSHNDADIERKHLAVLIPELAGKPWYSSQKDIPWGALGQEDKGLSQLAKAHDEKAPKNCMERALLICKLLQKYEPYSNQVYLKRLYNMQPMKPMQWTGMLKRQHNILSKKARSRTGIYITVILLVSAIGIAAYMQNKGLI